MAESSVSSSTGQIEASSTTTATQADHLPTKFPDRIDGVPERLRNRSNFELWEFYVQNTLQAHQLGVLIDFKVPRPPKNSAEYAQWEQTSLILRSWLVLQIEPSLVQELLITTNPTKYADEAYEAIKRLVLGHGHTLARTAYMKVFNMKRSFYASISQYVDDYRLSIRISNNLGCTITPYCACLLLLRELEPELPTWTASIELAFASTAATTLRERDFLKLCATAIEKGNDLDQRRAQADSATTLDWKRASWPRKGTSFEEHARDLRSQEPQYNGDKCVYCRYQGHGASRCLYLNPELRPEDWTPPTRGLWAYQYRAT